MSDIIAARMAARIDGDFVVFLIGLRINRMWKISKWLPVVRAMPRMMAELGEKPALGLLHARMQFGLPDLMMVQYWRSFEHLHRYATGREHQHLPAWRDFNRAIASNGDVGIWHETYLVRAGAYESVYNNMPAFGLGRAGSLVPAEGRMASARGRIGESDGSDRAA